MLIIKKIKVVPSSLKNELFIQKNGHFLINLKAKKNDNIHEYLKLYLSEVLSIEKNYISIEESSVKQYKIVKIKKNYFKTNKSKKQKI